MPESPSLLFKPQAVPQVSLDKLPSVARSGNTVAHRTQVSLRPEDLFHWLLSVSWMRLLCMCVAIYLLLNALFAALLWIEGRSNPDTVVNAETFFEYFAFSVQTFSTVGYGHMYPHSDYANSLMAVYIFVNMLITSMLTGLIFGRFSRPNPRIVFSKVAVISMHNGARSFIFRLANGRSHNRLFDLSVRISLMREEVSDEGVYTRSYYDLRLLRDSIPVCPLMFIAVHDLDDQTSPMYGCTEENIHQYLRGIVVTVDACEYLASFCV